jgi:prophage antirepressor-like protein
VGVENPRNVSARLADDQKDAVQIMDAIGRKQDTTIVNEAGLPLLRSGLLN